MSCVIVTPVEVEAPPTDEESSRREGALPQHLTELYDRSRRNLAPQDHAKLRHPIHIAPQ